MAFHTKRFYKNKVVQLEYRVKELEERLCPCESHTLKKVSIRYVDIGLGNIEPIYRYKCKVCGKEMEDLI